jgi:hypothetical protein
MHNLDPLTWRGEPQQTALRLTLGRLDRADRANRLRELRAAAARIAIRNITTARAVPVVRARGAAAVLGCVI